LGIGYDREKKRKENEKIIGKKGNREKKIEGYCSIEISSSCPRTQSGEAVLPNVFLKRLQLLHRIHSTSTTTTGAATATAGALPNAL
jgi:hypothetical protein